MREEGAAPVPHKKHREVREGGAAPCKGANVAPLDSLRQRDAGPPPPPELVQTRNSPAGGD